MFEGVKGRWQRRRDNMELFREEPEELAKLIVETAKSPEVSGQSLSDFVKYRFRRPFEHSLSASFAFGYAFAALTLIAIVGAVGSSLLAATSWGGRDIAIAVLGLSAALATTLNRIWQPGLRAAQRHQVANQLRKEGWALVRGQGPYACPKDAKALQAFFASVEKINRIAEEIDETPAEADSPAGN